MFTQNSRKNRVYNSQRIKMTSLWRDDPERLIELCGLAVLIILAVSAAPVVAGGGSPASGAPVGGDTLGAMYLTPWWNVTLGEGETLEVDCGVYTGGDPLNVNIYWKLPSGDTVSDSAKDRVYVTRTDKNRPSDSYPAAFSVVTMRVRNVTSRDTGNFTCTGEMTVHNRSLTNNKSIKLTVLNNAYWCGFESDNLCGWHMDNSSTVQWMHHNGAHSASMERSTGLRYDHTYGPSKHTGHFLDIDVKRDSPDRGGDARLLSVIYEPHQGERCLGFWYILHGTDYAHLKVKIAAIVDGNSTGEEAEIFSASGMTGDSDSYDTTNGEWVHHRAVIPQQDTQYMIVIEAVMCSERCRSASLALDDIHIHNSTCAEVNDTWPDTGLQVRLLNGSVASEGRVEVLHDGQWGTICSKSFGRNDTLVICKMLGYNEENVQFKRRADFGAAPTNYMIWLHKVACQGDETDLGSCLSRGEGWGQTGCTHDLDTSIICHNIDIATTPVLLPNTSPTLPAPTASPTPTPTSTPTPTPRQVSSTPLTSTSPVGITSAQPQQESQSPSEQTEETSATVQPTEYQVTANNTLTEKHITRNAGAAVAIAIFVIAMVTVSIMYVYKKRKNRRKNKYIVFSNPKYQREHLPTNDISLDSPLTSGHSILA